MPPPQGTFNPIEGPGDYTTTTKVHSTSYPAISPLAAATHAGKSVFIAGASRGIGAAMALSFARAGCSKIAIGARSSLESVKSRILTAASEASRPIPKVLCIELDITSQASTEATATLIKSTFGSLDILVVNAGIIGPMVQIAESDPVSWWNTWEVNVKGSYLVTRALLPLMLEGGDKTIIATASVGAHIVLPGVSSYQTGKLALVRLMEFVSAEYADRGVSAFTIHPGNCATDIVGGKEGREKMEGWMRDVFCDEPELSADTVVFLTREKKMWLAGRYVNCTWDMPELMAMEKGIVEEDKLKVKLVL